MRARTKSGNIWPHQCQAGGHIETSDPYYSNMPDKVTPAFFKSFIVFTESGSRYFPDPACCWIQIQSGSRSRPRFIMTKFVRKIIFEFFFFKNRHSVYVLKLPQRTFKLIIKRNFLIFSFLGGQFRPAWIRIRIPNPDPLTRLIPDPVWIQNTVAVRIIKLQSLIF